MADQTTSSCLTHETKDPLDMRSERSRQLHSIPRAESLRCELLHAHGFEEGIDEFEDVVLIGPTEHRTDQTTLLRENGHRLAASAEASEHLSICAKESAEDTCRLLTRSAFFILCFGNVKREERLVRRGLATR